MSLSVLNVSQLNRYIKSVIEFDDKLREIFVKGEISEFRVSFSGHAYFTLKDEKASVKCVMFSKNVDFLRFVPKEGMECIVRGYAGLYEQTGSFMLYAQDITSCGEGERSKEFKNLKSKLEAEGYFSEARKKKIPLFPKRIGVVTSLQGAALGDIKKTIKSRCPCVKIVISPTSVQGNSSPEMICKALDRIAENGFCDVIIIGRGGGSVEDLSAFNTEAVVKAVARCPVPVISAVGHERDVTLCDMASDFRAATPTGAAASAVPDVKDFKDDLKNLSFDLIREFQRSISLKKKEIENLSDNEYLKNINYSITSRKKYMHELENSLICSFDKNIKSKERGLISQAELLDAYSPLNILKRGFSYIEKDGLPVNSKEKLKSGENVTINFFDGKKRACILDD